MPPAIETGGLSGAVKSVRILEAAATSVTGDAIPSLLREINDRQWAAVLEVLFEAKFKAEALLRNDAIYESPGKVAHYQGWVTYADYVIGELETMRAAQGGALYENSPHPGPE